MVAMVNIFVGFVLISAVVSSVLCQGLLVGYRMRSVTGTGAGEQCPATQNLRESIEQNLWSLINNTVLPALSIQNQTVTQTPGNNSRVCGCGGPGWRRVAFLNMSNAAQNCPAAWELITSPRSCGRPSSAGSQSCYSAVLISCSKYSIQSGMWKDYWLPVWPTRRIHCW